MPKFTSSRYPGLIAGRGETRTKFVDGEAEATGKAAEFLRGLPDDTGVEEVKRSSSSKPAASKPAEKVVTENTENPDPVSPTAAGEPDPTSQEPPASPTAEGMLGDPASQKPPAAPTAEGQSAPKKTGAAKTAAK